MCPLEFSMVSLQHARYISSWFLQRPLIQCSTYGVTSEGHLTDVCCLNFFFFAVITNQMNLFTDIKLQLLFTYLTVV